MSYATGIIPARAGFTAGHTSISRPHTGSSPLARGLQKYVPADKPWAGIIPARAGFTRTLRSGAGPRTDHPRSRGVYIPAILSWAWRRGSSPLARGLPGPAPPRRRDPRIIPARAGFTAARPAVGPSGGDHPRSRGVYSVLYRGKVIGTGSSPLARSLLHPPPDGRLPDRDHPRSRGVYFLPLVCVCARLGSSPLARGLPSAVMARVADERIIPARAGFTEHRGPGGPHGGDHPRSRGVYVKHRRPAKRAVGSSPLARGLRPKPHPVRRRAGIIPARAGFTSRTWATVGRGGGSSPLARGLRPLPRVLFPRRRIIPARAGFTGPCGGVTATTWGSSPLARGLRSAYPYADMTPMDHPRSRGVYTARSHSATRWHGSSPLARGLRDHGPVQSADGRIIPARAGFTAVPGASDDGGQDHPRSRGVYLNPAFGRSPPGGSSPLARGLRVTLYLGDCRERIIPARAGFTRAHGCGTWVAQWIIPARAGFTGPGGCGDCAAPGSSPLARGLPMDAVGVGRSGRIIPARAGFTASSTSAGHTSMGSSPLARGLRAAGSGGRGPGRIIPARAGFTISL